MFPVVARWRLVVDRDYQTSKKVLVDQLIRQKKRTLAMMLSDRVQSNNWRVRISRLDWLELSSFEAPRVDIKCVCVCVSVWRRTIGIITRRRRRTRSIESSHQDTRWVCVWCAWAGWSHPTRLESDRQSRQKQKERRSRSESGQSDCVSSVRTKCDYERWDCFWFKKRCSLCFCSCLCCSFKKGADSVIDSTRKR